MPSNPNFFGVSSYRPQNSHRVIAAPESVMELLAGILPLAPLPVEISIQPRYFKSTSFGFLFYVVCGTKKEAPGDNAATSQRALMPWKEHVMTITTITTITSHEFGLTKFKATAAGISKGGIRTSTCKRSIRMRSL